MAVVGAMIPSALASITTQSKNAVIVISKLWRTDPGCNLEADAKTAFGIYHSDKASYLFLKLLTQNTPFCVGEIQM